MSKMGWFRVVRDTQGHWIQHHTTPPLFGAPEIFGASKLESLGYCMALFARS